MKRTATFGSRFLSVFTLALWAQAPPQMPKPGPEHQRLHYFVGDWETITEAKPSPFGPGGKITAKDHNVMLGDFFVVFHSDSTGPMGQQKTVAVMGSHPMEESRRGPASRGRIIEEVLHSDCWSSFCRSSGMEHAVDRLFFGQPPWSLSSSQELATPSFTGSQSSPEV